MTDKSMITKLASILLFHKGELTIRDIQALPTIETNEEVDLIVSWLTANFDVEVKQRRVRSSSIPEWEEFLFLKQREKAVSVT